MCEDVIRICWIAQSDENAQALNDAAINELRRLALQNIKLGFAAVRHRETLVDQTQTFIQSPEMQNIPRHPSIADKAKATGLERLYRISYGFTSLYAHGHNLVVSNPSIPQDENQRLIEINALLEVIVVIVQNWIDNRKQIDSNDIYKILGT